MDRKVVNLYVSIKLAHADSVFAEAKQKMERKNYVDLCMMQSTSVFPRTVLRAAERNIAAKYNIRPHKKLFSHPTVEQRITDVLGAYQPRDILAFFKQETGLSTRRLARERIGGQVLMRPALISFVEDLEKATGRVLLVDSDAPLAYLGDDVTLGDIADYFGGESPVIAAIRTANGL
jgi:hypothetical protein